MKINLLLSTLLIGLFSSCGLCKRHSDKNTTSANSVALFDTKWQLTELNGKTIANKINGHTPSVTFDKSSKRYSAVTGCNNLGGEFEAKSGNSIAFKRGMSTMMACQDMTVEQGLGTILSKKVNYNITNGILTLTSADNSSSAKFKVEQVNSNAALSGEWELDYIMEPSSSMSDLFPEKKPTISFNENKASGNAGCNNYSGTFKTEDHKISFGPMMSTKMACPSLKGESAFLNSLAKVNTYSLSDNQLTFIMGDIAIMRFKKK